MIRHKMLKVSLCAGGFLLLAHGAYGVPVHINSGNPAFPFPQFLEYSYGASHKLGNLGTKNPEGVVHAEMEQDIRDAYQIHANEFAYTGESWGGYQYIETPYKSAYDCTEGDGYGLLAAAYMGDAVTFNGYWMCTHDKRRNLAHKYSDCSPIGAGYNYGPFAISDDAGGGGNTAADGDVDVALALYVAYKQWGEFMLDPDGNIVNDACGNPISYKQEMIEVIRGLVALSTKFETENPMRINSGLIGLDGYPKGGDTWNEQTNFVNTANPITFGENYPIYTFSGGDKVATSIPAGTKFYPEFQGGNKQHIDYDAPAYYREFWELFEQIQKEAGIPDFEIEQFKRGEASSDWMMGDLIKKGPKAIPTAGWSEVSDDGSKTAYTNFNQGEDWRCSWRTICNYMWHGNPVNTWDPKTHKAVPGSNTYEYDAAVRLSDFLNNPIGWANGECMTYGDPKIPYSGPATTEWQYDPVTGETTDPAHFMVINWQNGTGTYAAVSAQDLELLGTLYRQCAIEWDTKGGDDCYLGSVSNYMHGWSRQMGMMVATGNYHAPSFMKPMANLKIYRAIEDSVTYCYTGDQIKFLLDYRNYGSVDAKDVVIVENVPADFVFLEASKGGVYNAANHTVTWKLGAVKGFNSKDGVDATCGQVWYKLKAGDQASGRYCTTADITCSNGLGWTTNEYPNYKTATMQRNCVDVVARSLVISKSVDRPKVNDGNMATYTIKFENSSDAGWIDGGRPRVNVSFANGLDGSRLQLMARLWNDAIEPYINYGNYRISYYMYDAAMNCYSSDPDCTSGWGLSTEIYEGNKSIGSSEGITVSHENVVEGSDNFGKWNQRMCIQFAPLLVTTTMHVSRFFGGASCRVHKGGTSPMRGVWALFPSNYGAVNWDDDWSWSTKYASEKDGLFFPVTPSWQKLDEKGKSIEEPVTKWLTCGCTESDLTVPNILVEEYDGYVWRRILGNGPMAGRDVDNVEIRDTLPVGLKFGEFVNECPLSEPEFGGKWEVEQSADGRDIIIWSIPKLQVKQKGSIIYTATASFPSGNVCETPDEDILNYAWIAGDKNSPVFDTALVTVTCGKVPEPIIPTTLTKEADKETYSVGDEITYTIGYKQTHGAIFSDAGAVATDWKLSGGATAAGGKVSVSSGSKAEFTKIANNIYIEATWNVADDQPTEIFFRDDIRLVFKNAYAGMSVECYDGAKLIDSKIIAKAKAVSKLCINLTDEVLGVWINKDTATSASVSFEGLTKKDGYFGFAGSGWGNFSYENIHVHTDYAYDLQIVDRVPLEVSLVDGTIRSFHNGQAAGTGKYYKASAADAQDSIVWTGLAPNPIAFGDTFTVVWKGVVDDCKESIINIAYAKLQGHADNEIMAQVVTGCGTTNCELEDAVAAFGKDSAFCEGDSIVFKVKLTDAKGKAIKGSFYYEFYKDKDVVSADKNKADSLIIKEPGDYKVIVYSTTDPTCLVESDPITITADKMPETVLADTSACSGTGASIKLLATEKNVTTYKYLWSDGSEKYTTTVTEDGEYTVAVTNGACVAHDTANVKFGSVVLKDGIFTLNSKDYPRTNAVDTGYVCLGTENTLAVNYKSDDGNFTWSSLPADASLTAVGGVASISPKVTTTYYVDFVQGCDARDSFVVEIAEPMEVTVKVDTLCNSLQLTASTTGSTKPTFTWTKDGAETTDNPLVIDGTLDPSGTVSVIATASDACQSEPVEVTYENVDLSVLVDGSASVCPGKSTELTASVTSKGLANPTYTYSWTDATGTEVAAAESATLPAGKYTLTLTDGICTKTAEHEIVNGTGEVKGDLTINGKKIIGSGRDRAYGSCGGELEIVADYTHDAGTDFSWTVNGQPLTDKANTITISPTQDTKVVVEFMNECAAIDSFFINMLDSVKIDTAQTRKCGETQLTASSSLPGVAYTWTDGTTAIGTGKTFNATLASYPTASGTAYVQGTADGYCDSRLMKVPFVIDTLGVTLDGPLTVCNGKTATLTAAAATSHAGMAATYAYGYRKKGSLAAFAPIAGTGETVTSPALTEATEFEVTATAGTCVAKATFIVEIGVPERDGHLTVDGVVADKKDAAGTKYFRTCGGAPIKLAVTHTATDPASFAWTMNGTAAGAGRELEVTPATSAAHVEQYIVTYVNECEVSDTINIEVYPLSVTADLSALDATYCQGESASAKLDITGYDPKLPGSFIQWTKDGVKAGDKATLLFSSLKPEASGVYTYVVSNGICTIPGAADAKPEAILKVNPYATIAAENAVVIATRGEDQELNVTTTPANATVTWKENGAAVGTGNPFTLPAVEAGHNFTAVATADGFCADSVNVTVKVDAKVVVALTVEPDSICAGTTATLTADTTGTGELLNPAAYKISYYRVAEDGSLEAEYEGGSMNMMELQVMPAKTSTYRAVVTYGSQVVSSNDVVVTVFPTPAYVLDYPKGICQGDAGKVEITDLTAGAEIEWKADSTLAGNGTSATVTPEKTTQYSFDIVQNNGICRQSVKFTVSVMAPVVATLEDETVVCEGNSVSLMARLESGKPTGYSWMVQGSSEVISNTDRLMVTPEQTTTYLLVVENGGCKADSLTTVVEVAQNPVIEDVVPVAVKDVQVVVSGGLDPYKFSVDGGEFADNDIITLRNFGVHKYKVVDLNGCEAERTDTLPAPEINIPVVITPNHDGVNDEFEVPGLAESYPDATIRIYDRWGKKLVEYEAKDGSWDGTYNGKKMPSTDYWYEIYIPELYKYFTGHFTLIND